MTDTSENQTLNPNPLDPLICILLLLGRLRNQTLLPPLQVQLQFIFLSREPSLRGWPERQFTV